MEDFFKYITVGEEDKEWGVGRKISEQIIFCPGPPYYKLWHPGGINRHLPQNI